MGLVPSIVGSGSEGRTSSGWRREAAEVLRSDSKRAFSGAAASGALWSVETKRRASGCGGSTRFAVSGTACRSIRSIRSPMETVTSRGRGTTARFRPADTPGLARTSSIARSSRSTCATTVPDTLASIF